MMTKYTGARVVWISSHEASSKFYDPKDWQLTKSKHSYQCSKYQMNMISLHLDREAILSLQNGTPAVRHTIAYPGVACTSIANALLGTFTSLCMYASLYIVSHVTPPAVCSLIRYFCRQDSWDPRITPSTSSRQPYLQSICRLSPFLTLVGSRAQRISRSLMK